MISLCREPAFLRYTVLRRRSLDAMPIYTAYFDTATHHLLGEACNRLLFSQSLATTSEDGFRSGMIACLAQSGIPLPLISTPSNRSGAADIWIGETRVEVKYAHNQRSTALPIFEVATDIAEVVADRCGFCVLGVSLAAGEHIHENPEKQHVRHVISLPGIPTETNPRCWYDPDHRRLSPRPTSSSLTKPGEWFAPGILLPVVHLAGTSALPKPIEFPRVAGSRGRATFSYMVWKEQAAIDTKSLLRLSATTILSCWVFGSPEIGRLVLLFTRVPTGCVEISRHDSWSPLAIKLDGARAFLVGCVGTACIKPHRYCATASEPMPIFSLC